MNSFNQSRIQPDLPNLSSPFCPFMLLKSAHIRVNYFEGRNTEPLPQRPRQDGRAQSRQGRAAPLQAEGAAFAAATEGAFFQKEAQIPG